MDGTELEPLPEPTTTIIDDYFEVVKSMVKGAGWIEVAETNTKDAAMAKAKTKKPAKKADPIFQWTFVSGQEVNGVRAVYTTLLRQDNSLTCNCPGWCFKKKGSKARFCKHTKKAEEGGEAEKLYKMWKKGETLPKQELHGGHVMVNSNPVAPSKVGYGRVIELS